MQGERLVGLVTHRDLLRAQARLPRGRSVSASEVMTREVETVSPETSVRQAIIRLLDDRFGCLPVVDARGKLVGILTESDIVRFAGRLLGEREQLRPGDAHAEVDAG